MKKKKKKLKKSITKNKSKAKKKAKKTSKKSNKFNTKFKSVKRINNQRKQKNKKSKKSKKILKKFKSISPKKPDLLLKLVNFQNSLKPEFKFRLNFGFEKYIQAFFDKIADTISQYKILKKDEARRLKLEKLEQERLEKIEIAKEKQKDAEL